VESTNGAIQVGVEHQKQGILGRKVSIDACLRVWKHGMHCNNENQFGNFFFIYPTSVHFRHLGAPRRNIQRHGVIYSVHIILL
jgi:hypothetical protein